MNAHTKTKTKNKPKANQSISLSYASKWWSKDQVVKTLHLVTFLLSLSLSPCFCLFCLCLSNRYNISRRVPSFKSFIPFSVFHLFLSLSLVWINSFILHSAFGIRYSWPLLPFLMWKLSSSSLQSPIPPLTHFNITFSMKCSTHKFLICCLYVVRCTYN